MSKKPIWMQVKKDLVKEIFVDWLGRLYVTPLNINWDWRERPSDGDDDSGTVYFEVKTNFPYRSVTLTCYSEGGKQDKESLQMFLLHEAMHCVLAPMDKARYEPWDTYKKFGEFVTDNLTHYVWQLCKCLWERDEEIRLLKKRRQKHGACESSIHAHK